MERYDYLEAIKADIREYIEDNDALEEGWVDDRSDVEERLYEELWVEDSVTGNASGSYTFSTWKAEEYICHNLELLGEALSWFSCDSSYLMENGAEACDVTIRCYLLGQALGEVLDELEDESEEE